MHIYKYFALDAKFWAILISGQHMYVNICLLTSCDEHSSHYLVTISATDALFSSEQVTDTECMYWHHIAQNQEV